MEAIQFIQITPQQFQELILIVIKQEIEILKKEFQPKEPTEFLTRSQVAELLKIDLSSVHNWTKKGKLIAYAMQGRVYYKRSEIEQAMIQL
ncbi:MAG: helix-turn-helix domain-containing protein [Limnohabitans sp.]|nr:helix-turn-helix domain-containing protein [Limnohabitans sp.]